MISLHIISYIVSHIISYISHTISYNIHHISHHIIPYNIISCHVRSMKTKRWLIFGRNAVGNISFLFAGDREGIGK